MEPDALDEKLAEARRVLARIPGVFGVGYGYKERGGTTTQELSFRVYVHEKKPLSEVPADEVVPAELFGVQTDVLLVIRSDRFACADTDAHSPLIGGINIANLKVWLAGGAAGGLVSFGTLGFFGTINGESSKDRYALLSNHHVLAADGAVQGDAIYQPQLHLQGGKYIITSQSDINPIASIHNIGVEDNRPYTYPDGTSDGQYFVDASTAKIDTCYSSWCDTNCSNKLINEIRDLGINNSNAIDGVARLRKEDAPQGSNYPVFKVGGATGRTAGKIKAVVEPVIDNATHFRKENCIIVENTGPNCGNGTKFADVGDSGSVLVNSARKVIGLIFGGDLALGTGHACHIDPVLAQVGITLISSTNRILGSVTTGLDVRARLESGPQVTRADAMRQEILDSERGQAYRVLVDRHREEVLHLVNRVRPVTIAWHRAHGPDFLAHLIHASHHAEYRVPRELHGLTRADAFARVFEALRRHGSAPLRADIERHVDTARALVEKVDDMETLAAHLRSGEAHLRSREGSPR